MPLFSSLPWSIWLFHPGFVPFLSSSLSFDPSLEIIPSDDVFHGKRGSSLPVSLKRSEEASPFAPPSSFELAVHSLREKLL